MRLLDKYDGFLFDLDGTVYVGNRPVPGAIAVFEELRRLGKEAVFLTNDPRNSRRFYVEKLHMMGIETGEQRIVTVVDALAEYLRQQPGLAGRTAYAIGSAAFKDEMAKAGLKLVDGDDARQAAVVVVGADSDFQYEHLRLATLALYHGAELYGCQRDPTFPMPDGPWPGAGAILAAIEYASGRRALTVGKPERFIFDLARALLVTARNVAVVGDRLSSDVAGGNAAGLPTILVLTGSTRPADLPGSPVQPTYGIESIRGLLDDETPERTPPEFEVTNLWEQC